MSRDARRLRTTRDSTDRRRAFQGRPVRFPERADRSPAPGDSGPYGFGNFRERFGFLLDPNARLLAMPPQHFTRRHLLALGAFLALTGVVTGCGDASSSTASDRVLRVGAIPDQDPEKLARLYGLVATYLGNRLDVTVEYVPVTEYAAAVSLFRAGDLDLVWFGGLTGVQATLAVPDSVVIAQRDIDTSFHSVFIANATSGIGPMATVNDLAAFAGKRFTFGSESSTSGRLMPQYFLDQAAVGPADFDGEPGFSGSHDKTIDLVASGTFEAGVLNEQVWRKRIKEGTVDTSKVIEVLVSPGYHDYHWILGPDAAKDFGKDFVDRTRAALTELSPANAADAAILDLFGTKAFVPANVNDYAEIEAIGRKLGLIIG
jgi:phosphonate transport system substrate-binding protein